MATPAAGPAAPPIRLFTAGYRRLLRLTKWLDERPHFYGFLSWTVRKRRTEDDGHLLSVSLNDFLRSSEYAIPKLTTLLSRETAFRHPHTLTRIVSRHARAQCFQCYTLSEDKTICESDNSKESSAGTQLGDSDTRSPGFAEKPVGANLYRNHENESDGDQQPSEGGAALEKIDLVGAVFRAIRQLKTVQNIARDHLPKVHPSDLAETKRKSEGNREGKIILPPAKVKVLNLTDDFARIKAGTFLISHPLSRHIWRRSLIFIHSVEEKDSTGTVKGVILNRRAAQEIESPKSSFVARTFDEVLRNTFNYSPLTSVNSINILEDLSYIAPGNLKLRFKNRLRSTPALERICRGEGWFGGPVPDAVLLRRGPHKDSREVICQGAVSIGRARDGQSGIGQHEVDDCSDPKSRADTDYSEGEKNESHKFFVGATAWDYQQLQNELRRGFWLGFTVNDPRIVADLVFSEGGDDVWLNSLSQLHGPLASMACLPTLPENQSTASESGRQRMLSQARVIPTAVLFSSDTRGLRGILFPDAEESADEDEDDPLESYHPNSHTFVEDNGQSGYLGESILGRVDQTDEVINDPFDPANDDETS